MICTKKLKRPVEILSCSVKGNILNVESLCIAKPSYRNCHRDWAASAQFSPQSLVWREAMLIPPAAVALNNAQTDEDLDFSCRFAYQAELLRTAFRTLNGEIDFLMKSGGTFLS